MQGRLHTLMKSVQLNGFGCNPSGADTEQEVHKPYRECTHRCSRRVLIDINYDVVLWRCLQLGFTVWPYMIMQPCHEDSK